MTYSPQPGTVAHRALEHLKTLPAGKDLSTAELAEALGIEPNSLGGFLEHSRGAGAICSEKRFVGSRHLRFWWAPGAKDGVEDEPVPAPPWPVPKPEPLAISLAPPAPGPAPDVPPAPAPATEAPPAVEQPSAPAAPEVFQPADEPEDFVCALWSDGKLQLQRGETELALLSVDETRVLVAYLERMAEVAT